ncbi:CGNR zinc finger domain-containing protein [Gordonia sp. VNQ95]|jgi:predicted RNA-binding Zn ribbon-like protein|uniref:CGNR zinc finger domain-containing protein n=1 Tax=Gordonia TaxID=2053 RepID=UPI0032B48565
MIFGDDVDLALQAAVTLVNSGSPPDTFETIADLDAYWERFGYTGRRVGDRAELDSVRAIRPRLRALLLADRDDAVDLVNTVLRRHRALPQLVRHGRTDWHLHAIDDDAPLADRIMVETAMALVDVIRADDLSRLAICADEGCDAVVLDLSRNRSRRYCSTACTNRNAVAAYRARQGDPEGARRA